MEIRNASNPRDVKHYTTDRLREEFHIAGLFTADNFKMVYSHIDRIITAGFMPVSKELKLEALKKDGNIILNTDILMTNNIIIEDNVKIGAGAVVLDNVPKYATVVGLKAKIIKNDTL